MTPRSGAWRVAGALLLAGILPPPAEAARHVIEIRNMSFGTSPAHLKTGDTIQWKNGDIFRHTATAAGLFDLDLAPGAEGEVTLKKSGVLTVICRYHPNMRLRLSVEKAP